MNLSASVLVIDDDPDMTHILQWALEKEGMRTLIAHSALEGLSIARRTSPAVIVADVQMPGMDGALMAELFQETEELRDTPVILISAIPEEELRRKATEARAFSYLSKPLDLNSVTAEVRRCLQEPKEGPLRQDLEEVRRAGERAAALTRQLLAFSRRQPPNPKVLDVNAVVSGIEKMLRRVIPATIRFDFALTEDIGCVRADPSQVDQVIMNLAINARDAMSDGGTLRIATSNVDLEAAFTASHPGSKAGRFVVLSVSDTGIGIPKEMLPHLFEPFFTTKGEGKGTGLGLATVYGITKQNEGFVTVASTPGSGTTFKIYLPRVDESPATSSDSQILPSISGTETVLVVDDDSGVRGLVAQCLRAQGYQVLQAGDAAEAEVIVTKQAGPLDLLLTDMVMPGISGRDLATKIRGRYPDLKVLYMSGYTEDVALNRGKLEPGARFISKPFLPHELLSRVRKVLSTDRRTAGR